MNTMKWLLKREQWEHRGGFFWAPIVVSGIIALISVGSMLFATVMGRDSSFHIDGGRGVSLSQALAGVSQADKLEIAQGIAAGYPAIAMPVMITLGFVVFFYALGCLYDERKDRSILFWKSLPISDRDSVVAKALTALVIGPMIAIAVALALALLVTFVFMLLAAFHGMNLFGAVLGNGNFYLVIGQILSFVPIYVLWALPTVGYLMFVSSWAKTKPFLWAVGVPVLGGVILSWINFLSGSPFNLEKYWEIVVGRGLFSSLPGVWMFFVPEQNIQITPDNFLSLLQSNTYSLLATTNLWIGVVLGLAFLAGAVRMRRYRDEG